MRLHCLRIHISCRHLFAFVITVYLRASDLFCPGIFKSTMIGLPDLQLTTLPPFIPYDQTETNPTKLENALYIAKAHSIWRYRAAHTGWLGCKC